jgi:hypothetical protein
LAAPSRRTLAAVGPRPQEIPFTFWKHAGHVIFTPLTFL